jgi:hypothetical protein
MQWDDDVIQCNAMLLAAVSEIETQTESETGELNGALHIALHFALGYIALHIIIAQERGRTG